MPAKIGGGNKMEEYDPTNGRYCGSFNGFTKSYSKAMMLYDSYSEIKSTNKNSKMMPNYKKAITPDEKFVKYSLDETHEKGKHKAIVYKKVLGFTKDNFKLLKNQIHKAITSGTASLISINKNNYGIIEYNYEIRVVGINNKSAIVVAKYGISKTKSKPFMITNYVK